MVYPEPGFEPDAAREVGDLAAHLAQIEHSGLLDLFPPSREDQRQILGVKDAVVKSGPGDQPPNLGERQAA